MQPTPRGLHLILGNHSNRPLKSVIPTELGRRFFLLLRSAKESAREVEESLFDLRASRMRQLRFSIFFENSSRTIPVSPSIDNPRLPYRLQSTRRPFQHL